MKNKIIFLMSLFFSANLFAELIPEKIPILSGDKYIGASVVEDSIDNSQDPFRDRIFFYDMVVDSTGKAYIIYASPKPAIANSTQPEQASERSEIIFAVENGDTWDKTVLSTQGLYRTAAVQIAIDSKDKIYMTYTRKLTKDINGVAEFDYLVYRTHTPATGLSEEFEVGDIATGNLNGLGGWRTRISMSPDDKLYMVREFEGKLNLLIPNADNWMSETIVLPATNWSRIGDFHIDALGRPHIIYGDYAYNQKGEPYQTGGDVALLDHFGFHNLHYATSTDLGGNNWTSQILDENTNNPTASLYNFQFWVDLALDDNNNPAVAKWLWKPDTVSPQAYDTKTIFFNIDEQSGQWQSRQASSSFDGLDYLGISQVEGVLPGTVGGMGPSIISGGKGSWHAVWDNSNPRPFEHFSARGGIIYRFSSDGNGWDYNQLLAPFSGEGRSVVRIKNGMLNVLVLGDHTDTQLYFLRYRLPDNNIMEVYPTRETFYAGETIKINALVKEGGFVGDWYLVALSRPIEGLDEAGDIWFLSDLSSFTWTQVNDLANLKPTLSGASSLDFNGRILEIPPLTAPFTKQREYDIYSVVSKSGVDALQIEWLTPLFHRHIFANWPLP